MNVYAVVLAAGKGTRMKSSKPKVSHELLYKPIINHVCDEVSKINVTKSFVVVGYQAAEVKKLLSEEITTVLQEEQLGTGHAVKMCEEYLENQEGITIVINGDAPLIQASTLEQLVKTHIDAQNKATVITAHCDISKAYGRIVRDENGSFEKIVEMKDASNEEIQITEMNTGVYCFDNKLLFNMLKDLKNNNNQNEYYLTDVIGLLHGNGHKIDSYIIDDFDEVGGVNDRLQLALASKKLQNRINTQLLLDGVTIVDPSNTYIGRDVVIGVDTVIEPGTIIKGNTVIGSNCKIGPHCEFENVIIKDNVEIKFSVISDSIIESGVDIGPYARLRKDCHILENVHMGNFVEMKNTTFGVGSKCAHLSYIGDATVGKDVNIGCGTITSNYDGKNKFKTIIGDNAFVGCNSNLVAPITLENGAYIAAGSTITDNVPEDAFAIARQRQNTKQGYAKVLKEKRERI